MGTTLTQYVDRVRDELKDPVVLGTDSNDYRCILKHTAASANKPVTGGSYATNWVADPLATGTIGKTWVDGWSYSETRWTNATLEDHVTAAVKEYSKYRPLKKIDSAIDAAQTMDISGITDMITAGDLPGVTGLGWPDTYAAATSKKPRMRGFIEYPKGTTLMFFEEPSSFSGKADIYYNAYHAVSATGTVPTEDDEIIVYGACMYALEEYANYMADRVSQGDPAPFYAQAESYKTLFYNLLGAKLPTAKK